MRIAMICREMPPVGGGAGAVALQLSRELVAVGHEVVFFTMRYGSQSAEDQVDGLRVIRIPCGRRRVSNARLVEMLRFLRSTRRRLREEHAAEPFDVVHAHSILPEGAVPPRRGFGCRTVITAHGSDVPGYNPDRYEFLHRAAAGLWRSTLRRADVVTAPSEFLADLIRAAEPNRSIHVIPNGIDGDLLAERDDRSGILIAARLEPRKNVRLAMEALDGLPATRVDIVGDGPELPRLKAFATKLEDHEIHFHGWLEHGSREWREAYERARFFVFMSSKENFPINLLEAQLAGLVTVASAIPSNREVLGEAAEFVPIGVEPLRSRLEALLAESSQSLNQRGHQARMRVLTTFLWPDIRERFLQLYR